jgi:hypothetical protein
MTRLLTLCVSVLAQDTVYPAPRALIFIKTDQLKLKFGIG